MNPIETEEHIRRLDVILALEPVRQVLPEIKNDKKPEFVFERYVITDDGKMSVERPNHRNST